jgi:ABC-type transport system involved in multi-copper enzyme maturation permease subunit
MPGVVFFNTLRRSRRGTLLWGIGVTLLIASQIAILPDVDALKQFAELVESMPFVVQMIGAGEDVAFLASPEGFLAGKFFSIALLLFAVYALVAGLNVTANEEDRGIMDMLLSLPIKRWRLVVERLAAYAVTVLAIILIALVGIVVTLAVVPNVQIDALKVLAATVNILPGAVLVLAFTALAGTVFRTRGQAVAASTVFVILSYFIDFIGGTASGTLFETLRVFSFFRYYDSASVLKNGLQWGNIVLVLAVSVVCSWGAVWFFERRDTGG